MASTWPADLPTPHQATAHGLFPEVKLEFSHLPYFLDPTAILRVTNPKSSAPEVLALPPLLCVHPFPHLPISPLDTLHATKAPTSTPHPRTTFLPYHHSRQLGATIPYVPYLANLGTTTRLHLVSANLSPTSRNGPDSAASGVDPRHRPAVGKHRESFRTPTGRVRGLWAKYVVDARTGGAEWVCKFLEEGRRYGDGFRCCKVP